jgi:hypothetical protein
MLILEIVEGYKQAWGKNSKGRMVRRYRCTDGPKKGRLVAKPSTCSTRTSQRKSATLKKTRRSKGKIQSIKRNYTMKRPTSYRVRSANKSLRRRRNRRR